jgi:hypothetical protein
MLSNLNFNLIKLFNSKLDPPPPPPTPPKNQRTKIIEGATPFFGKIFGNTYVKEPMKTCSSFQ